LCEIANNLSPVTGMRLHIPCIAVKVANTNNLEMVVADWQGCGPMPEDVKDVLTTNEYCLELFAKYGELLSANIQKVNAKGKDKCAAIGFVFVLPGNVMHAGPPCPKKRDLRWFLWMHVCSWNGCTDQGQ
jgi:hypothetical protein